MSRRDFFIACVVGVLLAVVITQTSFRSDHPARAESRLGEAGSPEVVAMRELILRSHRSWQTLDAVVVTHWYLTGRKQSWLSEIQIDQQNNQVSLKLFRLGAEEPAVTWISDGRKILSHDHDSGEMELREAPAFLASQELFSTPETLADIAIDADGTRTIVRHPLGMLIPSPAGDYIYPVGFAQRGGSYKILGHETLLGRSTTILEFSNAETAIGQRFWIDEETGITLKSVNFESNDMQEIIEETYFTSLLLDTKLPEAVFQIP